MRSLFIIQALLVAAVAGYFAIDDTGAAGAALYGGAIALSNSMLLAWRVARATANLKRDAKRDVASLYLGAVQRFLFTLVAMVVGMGFLKLDPIALLIAFGVAQVAFFFAASPRPGAA